MAYFDGTHSKATSDWKMSFRVDSIWKEEKQMFVIESLQRAQHPKKKEKTVILNSMRNPGGAYDGDISLPFVITTPTAAAATSDNNTTTI